MGCGASSCAPARALTSASPILTSVNFHRRRSSTTEDIQQQLSTTSIEDQFHAFFVRHRTNYEKASTDIESALDMLLKEALTTIKGDTVSFEIMSRVKDPDSAKAKLEKKQAGGGIKIDSVVNAISTLHDLIGVRLIFDRPLDQDSIDVVVDVLNMEGKARGINVVRRKLVRNGMYQGMHVICQYVTEDTNTFTFELQLRDKYDDNLFKISHAQLYKPCAISGLPNPKRNHKHVQSIMVNALTEKAGAARRLRRDDRLKTKRPRHEFTDEPILLQHITGLYGPHIENLQSRR